MKWRTQRLLERQIRRINKRKKYKEEPFWVAVDRVLDEADAKGR